jgi:ribosomal protein S18 acetylase RimI-like enzyme
MFRPRLPSATAGHLAELRIRALVPADQASLWDWLHVALWDPPPAPPRPREVLEHPQVSIYAKGWGRPGDIGVVGEVDGRGVGACWMRQLPAGVGLASVDGVTPQLGIAVMPAFQRRGYGIRLMRAALAAAGHAGVRKVSLTVHPLNPAIAMYERCGFAFAGERGTYHLMVAEI